jgi:DNA replication protein DnaC
MSEITTPCAGCGIDLTLEIPDGDSGVARWLRSVARKARCDECAEKQEEFEAERERCRVRDARRDRCQLPRGLRGQTLDRFEARPGQERALDAAREWATTARPQSLVLTGGVGVGKTALAGAACWTRLERWPCKYASVARSMAKLNGSFTDEGREEAVRFFAGSGAAVLDDLDKCRATDFGREQLFAAIDGRQQAGAPLLVTTNLTPDQIGETFGDALMSRLAAPHCRVVEVGGADHRVEVAR